MRMPVRVRRRLDIFMSLWVLVGGGIGGVYEPVDYVVTVEILHSFQELLHEAFDCHPPHQYLHPQSIEQKVKNIPSLSENLTFA